MKRGQWLFKREFDWGNWTLGVYRWKPKSGRWRMVYGIDLGPLQLVWKKAKQR